MPDDSTPAQDPAPPPASRSFWRSRRLWVLSGLAAGGFAAGIVFWGGFHTVVEATNTMAFCTGCHEMRQFVYSEYATTIHYQNRTGVQATCADCHVPREWLPKMLRKAQATNELWHWALGTIDTKEEFEEKRLELAKHVWRRMKETDSLECRNCHTLESMNPEFQRPRARKVHLDAFKSGQTCIDCHKGVAHHSPRERLTAAEIEALEQPNPAFVRDIPQRFLDGLARVTAREADEAKQREAEAARAEAAVAARIREEVARALAAAAPGAAATPGQADATDFGVDWSAVPAKTVTLFYPGEASFEWIQVRDHGGARGFLRSGERCAECHGKELKEIGTRIAAGERLESTPIPGKRPWIDVAVRAVHDGTRLVMRFEWADTPHAPAPFVAGGKMDPAHPTKLAMMITGTGVERGEQAGCWATCHTDSRSMADAGKVEASKLAGLVADEPDAALADGLTKYLAETRTRIDLQGKDGIRGGGANLKSPAEVEALLAAGTVMDLVRLRPGEAPENGKILAQRTMRGGGPVEGAVTRQGGRWVATLRRPLAADRPGDVAIVPGTTYTVGFAIHDDFSNARFHHVSLELRMALDDPNAEIAVTRR